MEPAGDERDTGELVRRAKAGDRQALERLLADVAPSVRRFGLRMCKNAHDADDVLQDTLVNVASHLGEFEGRSSLSSWVFTLARTACSRKRRGLKNRPPVDDTEGVERADTGDSPERSAERNEMSRLLTEAMDGLADDHREVILLRDIEGLSANETAETLGISVDAVKSRLHRARSALREALRPVLEPHVDSARATCPDVVSLWSRKLEGDLSQADCGAMERHIEGCPTCAAACDALKGALAACRRVKSDDVPADVQERVRAAVRAWAGGAVG
ncbi:MAG: sigma-70 family RNA polymerase sigma factor [Polyangiaceae bacterium]